MLLILSALKEEIKPILHEMDVVETVNLRPAVIMRGEYLGKEIVIAHTGAGCDKMQRTAEFCIKEYKPELLINVGYCGALSPNLSLGDIVIADSVIHETKGNSIATNSNTEKIANICANNQLKFHKGVILSVDKVVETPHEKAYLGTKFSAIAVDMESFGLARAAENSKTAFAVIRSVLDPMDMHLPSFENMVSDDGTTNILGLAVNMVCHPQKALHLPQLQFCASKARETMMKFLNEFIKA